MLDAASAPRFSPFGMEKKTGELSVDPFLFFFRQIPYQIRYDLLCVRAGGF